MADVARYVFRGLSLSGTARTAKSGSLINENRTQDVRNAGTPTNELQEVMAKRFRFRVTLNDPSIVTAAQTINASGATYTGAILYWQAYTDLAGLGTTWKSATIAKGLVLPVSLTADRDGIAEQQIDIIPAFVGGVAVTWGTSSFTPDVADVAYRVTNVVVGGDTETVVGNVSVTWNYNVLDLKELEPAELYYDRYDMTLRATLGDIATGSQSRMEDTAVETTSVLFTDQKNGANTVSVSLGTMRNTYTLVDDGMLEVNGVQVTS